MPNSGRKAQSRVMSLFEHEENKNWANREFELHTHPCKSQTLLLTHILLIINYKGRLTFQTIQNGGGKSV